MQLMAKKITAAIMALVLLVTSFSGCSLLESEEETIEETTTETTTTETVIPNDDTTFKLSYTQSDSLNPFEATTQNNQIVCQLVFESLFDVDDNYKATLNIASDYEYTGTKTLKVTIAEDLEFSNGEAVTATKVKSSFDSAKDSDYWSGTLDGISSCTVEDSNTVVFKLAYANPYAHNLLTFPIVWGEDDDGYAVGSGRYYFAKEDGETVLKAYVTSSFSPKITTIHLENITSLESIDNAVNIGNISFAFRDLSEGSSTKISANKKLVNMNNLVYLGLNTESGICKNTYIRKAISLAVDRSVLVESAYGSFAQVATGLFNPQFELSDTELFDSEANTTAAEQAIEQSGRSSLSISILVNKGNSDRVACAKLIKQQLEDVGFTVTITSVSYSKYKKKIKKGNYDIYIGEVKITNDMSLYNFLDEDGSTNWGIDTDGDTATAYAEYMSGEAELGTFLLAYADEMPYIPLLYRKGMVCFSKAMNGDVQSTWHDVFKNIENWYFTT